MVGLSVVGLSLGNKVGDAVLLADLCPLLPILSFFDFLADLLLIGDNVGSYVVGLNVGCDVGSAVASGDRVVVGGAVVGFNEGDNVGYCVGLRVGLAVLLPILPAFPRIRCLVRM